MFLLYFYSFRYKCLLDNYREYLVTSIFDSNKFNQNLFFPRPDEKNLFKTADDIFVEVEPGCKIHLRRHIKDKAKFSLLFFHGNGEIVSDYDILAQYFTALGCELIVCDYRGYGRSEGNPTLRMSLKDASIIYKFLRDENILKPKVAVMGRSLGSAPAIDLCIRFSSISCCVVESGFSDPLPLVERRGMHIDKITPEENKLYNNSEKIRSVTCPILIMHGEDDFLIPLDEAILNHQNAGSENKVLAVLKGAGHNDMMMAPNNSYFNSLSKFFKNTFP